MAEEIEIKPEDVTELLAKLDELATNLNAHQKALLRAIIRVSVDIVRVEAPEEEKSFSEEFRDSFTPGKANALVGFAIPSHIAKFDNHINK